MAFTDRTLKCVECGEEFVFSAGEQEFFQFKHFVNDPRRCKRCKARRAQGRGNGKVLVEFAVTCSECGAQTSVPFRPRQGRPVLCRVCFDKHRSSQDAEQSWSAEKPDSSLAIPELNNVSDPVRSE